MLGKIKPEEALIAAQRYATCNSATQANTMAARAVELADHCSDSHSEILEEKEKVIAALENKDHEDHECIMAFALASMQAIGALRLVRHEMKKAMEGN